MDANTTQHIRQIARQTDGWMDGCKRRIDGWMHRWMHACMHACKRRTWTCAPMNHPGASSHRTVNAQSTVPATPGLGSERHTHTPPTEAGTHLGQAPSRGPTCPKALPGGRHLTARARRTHSPRSAGRGIAGREASGEQGERASERASVTPASLTGPAAAAGGCAASPGPAPPPHGGDAGRPSPRPAAAEGGSGSGPRGPRSAPAAAPACNASPRGREPGVRPSVRQAGWQR